MANISSNYVYILFVCTGAVIYSECEILQKQNTMHFILVYNVYYHEQPKGSAVNYIYSGEN